MCRLFPFPVLALGLLAAAAAGCRHTAPAAPALTPAEGRALARYWERFLRRDPEWPRARARWLAGSQPARNLLVENLIRYMGDRFYRGDLPEAKRAAAELVLLDRLALEHLLAILTTDRNALGLRPLAADCLARIGAPAVPGLVAALRARRRQARKLAAATLGRIGDPRAVAPLTARLRAEGDFVVRVACVEALARFPGAPATAGLVEALADADAFVAARAAAALARRGDIVAVRPLARRLAAVEGAAQPDLRLRRALRGALHELTGLPRTSPPAVFLAWRPGGGKRP